MLDQTWANSAIRFCLANGVDHFFIAPGSRCTPLTLAVARHDNAQVIQHFDERGLGFAALGYARATGRPGVFICTSGTAVANAFPAVIEAAMEGVPLLLFTADRPTELRGSGANQTIDQRNIFGTYPKLFFDMPAPQDTATEDDPQGEAFMMDALERGFAEVDKGPVHFNWMFREPFTIEDEAIALFECRQNRTSSVFEIARINVRGNVLIALGGCNPQEAAHALKLSERLNCPIVSDVTSGLRAGSFELPSQFSLPKPDTILHLGGRIVSKSWHQWTGNLRDADVEFIHVSPNGQVINPNGLDVVRYEIAFDDLESVIIGSPSDNGFREAWRNAAEKRNEVLEKQLSKSSELSEPAIANFISQACPTSDGLFLGNSTPIRDMDWFGVGTASEIRNVAANRGASGIDGLLATAVGYAKGLQKTTTVVIGDLSALHDMNSLSLIGNSPVPLVVLIINNSAGHIFDLLPIRQSAHFEKYFATPHEYQFEHAARMFGLDYRRVSEMGDFRESYPFALLQEYSTVIELITDRQTNLEVRQRVNEEIKKCASED